MPDRKKIIKALEWHIRTTKARECKYAIVDCPYVEECRTTGSEKLLEDILSLLKEQEKEIKSLRLLIEWADECGFEFDQFSDEYTKYKDEIKEMKYIDGMIHVAKRTLEDHGVFEEGDK